LPQQHEQQDQQLKDSDQKDDESTRAHRDGSELAAQGDLFSSGRYALYIESFLSDDPDVGGDSYYCYNPPDRARALYRRGSWVVGSRDVMSLVGQWANSDGCECYSIIDNYYCMPTGDGRETH
jgi:hypothetical protein